MEFWDLGTFLGRWVTTHLDQIGFLGFWDVFGLVGWNFSEPSEYWLAPPDQGSGHQVGKRVNIPNPLGDLVGFELSRIST